MSLFDAFVGGAADQATGILDRQMKEEADLERQKQLTQFQADLAEAKLRTTAAIQRQLAQQDADMMTSRVGQNAEKAGQDWYDKQNFGDPDIGDPSALTEEQQSVINQAMTKRQQDLDSKINSYKNNPRSMVQAKVELGQESPDKLMTFDQKDQSLAMQQENLERQKAALDENIRHHQENEDIRRDSNDIKSQLGALKGNLTDTEYKLYDSRRADLDSRRKEIQAQMTQANKEWSTKRATARPAEIAGIDSAYDTTMQAIQQKLDDNEQKRNELSDLLMNKIRSTVKQPASTQAPTSSIPSGYTIIGQTPKGQTVYRTPDGKTVVSKG